MKKLLLASLSLLLMAASPPTVTPPSVAPGGDASNTMVCATGGSVCRTAAAQAADRVNIRNFGAVGDGTTDDSSALQRAVTFANTRTFYSSSHTPMGACVYLPAGRYLIKTPPGAFSGAGCVLGDGAAQSVIVLDPTFGGDLFAWAEAWIVYGTSNPRVVGVGITGAPTASAQQNALMFYDRNDNLFLQDVYVQNVPGRCLGTGILRPSGSAGQAYIRESHFRSVRCFSSGATGVPAVEFATQGTGQEDGTNEVSVSQMDIYGSAGPSLVIRNSSATGTIRNLKFDALRIEGKENGTTAADLLNIGDSAMSGGIGHISFTNLELIDPYTNYCAVNVASSAAAGQGPSRIHMQGYIGGGLSNGKGACINNGSLIRMLFDQIRTTGTNITIGPSATGILLDGLGAETGWTYSIDSTSLTGVSMPLRRAGDPSATGATAGAANVSGTLGADSGAFTGLTLGNGGLSVTGGSVTSITLTNTGSYTGAVGSVPLLTIAAPPSGSTASAAVTGMSFSQLVGGAFLSGTNYVVGDILTGSGGTIKTGVVTTFRVTAVDANGKPTTITGSGGGNTGGVYSALPPDVQTFTGGSGTGGTARVAYYIVSTSVTSGGTGYQTQPVVTGSSSAYGTASGVAAVSTNLPIQAATGKVQLDTTGTTLGTSGTTGGPVKSLGALIDSSGVRVALGSTYTVPANTSLVRLTQGSTVASSTITLPTALADGQSIQLVNYAGAITALTFSPAVNGWTNGSQLAAYSGARVRWDATSAAWYREQ